ncbi:MAG: hypothetical protein AAFW98_07340 [Pseudomonadota bacterium]
MDDIILAHTATKLHDAKGRVVICGSHGGTYVGLVAAAAGVRAIILNDAGMGLDNAGIAGLDVCARHGVAAAAVHHTSARIGDAQDTAARGIICAANLVAQAAGVTPGMKAAEAAERLRDAPLSSDIPAVGAEHRTERKIGNHRLLILDSNALVRPGEDDGAIIVTASHGGLVGGDPASAGRADALLFAFNDAGAGIDDAGISRLPALEARGVAAVCVDAFSAHIGEGQSIYEDGIISHLNAPARAKGATQGQPLKALIDTIAKTSAS